MKAAEENMMHTDLQSAGRQTGRSTPPESSASWDKSWPEPHLLRVTAHTATLQKKQTKNKTHMLRESPPLTHLALY